MNLKALTRISFPRDLFLDRRKARYCFGEGADRVLVVQAGKTVTRRELEALFLPFVPVEPHWDETMFEEDVVQHLLTLIPASAPPPIRPAAGQPPAAQPVQRPAAVPPPAVKAPPPPAVKAAPPAPAPAQPPPKAAPAPPSPPKVRPPAPPRSSPPRPPAPSPPPARPATPASPVPGPPAAPPALKVLGLREELREQVFEKITTPEGRDALLGGKMDGEIQGLVAAICQEVMPRQILAAHPGPKEKSDTDVFMDHAMTSQAFGLQFALGQTDLFLMAKSAILQSLTEADRKNIQTIKQALLLGKPSATFQKRLSQYYQEITKYLRLRKTDPLVTELIERSKYIYFEDRVDRIPEPALALGVADGFVTLQEGGKLTLEILRLIPQRLRRILQREAARAIEAVEGLLRDSCYNEFHKALHAQMSGGDYCSFFPISPTQYGLVIFDVSGHEEQASGLRDLLVQVLEKLPGRGDPAKVVGLLNRFVVQYPFPEDVFVSMVYGVLDATQGTFTYANAGHHPPYLVRADSLNRLEETGGLALNMGEDEYENGSVVLVPRDCLVLYTDGLTEAVQLEHEGSKELFGHRRLETAITGQKIGGLKAKRAVESILSAVRDQGFQIEDDITIQVYRHI
jgi:serine phosphatase RsbU (regulator of sigma subunit)